MKRLNYAIRGMITCLGIFMVLCMYGTESQAAKYLDVNAVAKNETTVEISWQKKSVTGYEIYRAKQNESGDIKNYKKIATVSGKTTKYTDKTVKYKNYYSYEVKAYKKSGSKKKYMYEGGSGAYTAMDVPSLLGNGTLYEWSHTTNNSIYFSGGTAGISINGFEIYRKEGSSKYKKIKTIKVKEGIDYFDYTDKKVKRGKTYFYKVRTYRIVYGKKQYSKFSNVIKLRAVKCHPTYTVQNLVKGEGKTKSIVVGLTSNKGNGDILFKKDNSYNYYNDSTFYYLVAVKYSLDNVNWIPFPDNGVKISEYQTIYIMFEEENGNEIDFYSKSAKSSGIECWPLYENDPFWFIIDFKKLKAFGDMYSYG